MATFTIHTDNNEQSKALKEFMNKLKIKFEVKEDNSLYDEKNELLIDEQIIETEHRLSLLKEGKLKKRSWEDAKKEIFQK